MAWTFDGVDDRLVREAVVPTASCTVSLWIRPAALSDGVLFETYATGGWDRGIQVSADGTVSVHLWTNPGDLMVHATSPVAAGAWSHVLYRHGPTVGGQRLVVDGDATDVAAQSFSHFAAHTHISLASGRHYTAQGAYNGVRAFNGAVAEFAVWGTEISPHEEEALALGLSPASLTARLDSMLVYEDLVRPLGRFGIGAPMSAVGQPVVTPHPTQLVGNGAPPPRTPIYRAPTPYLGEESLCWSPGSELGQVVSGVEEQRWQ